MDFYLITRTLRSGEDLIYEILKCRIHTSITQSILFLGDVLCALQGVIGRRHPSTAQSRELKHSLPTMSVVLELLSSQVTKTLPFNTYFQSPTKVLPIYSVLKVVYLIMNEFIHASISL